MVLAPKEIFLQYECKMLVFHAKGLNFDDLDLV